MDILQGLNDRQIEAVTAIDGNIRVTAGAGSGKTRVLAHRYAFLVNEVGIVPSNILCMTFTNKAAQEMKNRIARMVNGGDVNDFVCTIHGFCVKFLREEIFRLGYPKNFPILDTEDSKDLAKLVLEEFNMAKKTTVKKFLDTVRKNKFRSNYISSYLLPNNKDTKETSFSRYLSLQQKSFALDFDDLIQFTLYIMQKYKDVKTRWQKRFYYIMVDEAQDCNLSDWKIINNLVGKRHNLFIVGDPDQAIYEWRGATPAAFVSYASDQDVILDENYRSTPDILGVANSVISNNKNRIKKELFTKKKNGKIAIHYHGKSEEDEGLWIANQIEQMSQKDDLKYSDFAILYRASYMSRFVEQALLRKKIPYTVWGGIRFFERKEVKDAIAYLRLSVFRDDISLRRIINVPSRKFGKVSQQRLSDFAENEGASLFEALTKHSDSFADNVKDLIQLVQETEVYKTSHSITDTLDYLLKESGYKDMLRLDDDQERLDNLQELLDSIKYYEQVNKDEPAISIETYLQDVALYTNADYKKDTPTVKLMTIHQAKGLEFPYVFVCGLTEGQFPSHRSIREGRDAALEEERRLMYVAITRAERGLFLTESEGYSYATKTDKYPSRFLLEIKDNLIKVEGNIDPYLIDGTRKAVEDLDIELHPERPLLYKKGDIVSHKYFGVGKIMSSSKEDRSYKVKFKNFTRDIDERMLSVLDDNALKHQKEIDNKAKVLPFLFVCTHLYEESFFKHFFKKLNMMKVQSQNDQYIAEDISFSLTRTICNNLQGSYYKLYSTRNYTGNKIFHIGSIIRIGNDLFQIIKLVGKSKDKKEDHYKYMILALKDGRVTERISTKFWKKVFLPVFGEYYEQIKEHRYLFLCDIDLKGTNTALSFIDSKTLDKTSFKVTDIEEIGLSICEKSTYLKNCKDSEEFKRILGRIE